jgi:hypothetical protein
MLRRISRLALIIGIASFGATAHVGSPDIYLEGQAGPYKLFITVRPPMVIPGVAELEIRSETSGVQEIRAVPLPMSGPGARFSPVPDQLKVSAYDPRFFTGTLWMMASGSWQVKVSVSGLAGTGTLAVPVPSAATSTKKMQAGLGALLSVLMTFLVFGLVAIVGASVREAKLVPGIVPDHEHRKRGRVAMALAFVIVLGVIWYGMNWWDRDAISYGQNVYKPLGMKAVRSGNLLTLNLSESGMRSVDDLIPDHGHLMHLYLIRQPDLDVVYHLHPELQQAGVFQLELPTVPTGTYKLYADIVHQSGFPETLVTSVNLPGERGRALSGDDASATTMGWRNSTVFSLADGYRMEWIRPAGAIHAKEACPLQFRLLNAQGKAPNDMALYMGMLGHAAFLKTDGSTFAHIHPTGTVSMAAFMMAQGQKADEMSGMNMSGMDMSSSASGLPNQVSFPYGFPSAGRYRAFVQMKHGNIVETGIFDMQAE